MNSTSILVLALASFAVGAFRLFRRRPVKGSSSSVVRSTDQVLTDSASRALSVQETPDTPQSFGYKMTWFAIPTADSTKVMSALGLTDAIRANWASGVGAVYEDTSQVFVAPPVDGWTLVLGLGLPSFDTPDRTHEFLDFIDRVAASFPEFYYFGTHRVVEFHGWVKVAGGKIERAYAYLGESGETLYESGKKTPEEISLGFAFFDERSPEAASEGYFQRKDLRFPDEEDVMKISAAWAINTQTLDQRTEKGTGYLAKISQGRTSGFIQ